MLEKNLPRVVGINGDAPDSSTADYYKKSGNDERYRSLAAVVYSGVS